MKPIWHIYYATRGTAGSYIDALLKASESANVPARAFVSARYKYATAGVTRCFFNLTDRFDRRGSILRIIRGSELIAGYMYIIFKIVVARPKVCIHWIDDFYMTYVFFRLCKALGLQVILTCHDVSSHYLGMNARRKSMIRAADRLIVHNAQARQSLVDLCGPEVERKLLTYPFPTSSYDEILSKSESEKAQKKLRPLLGDEDGYFLFLGVVRKSKGIETLLDAWRQTRMSGQQRLVIAGSWTDPSQTTRDSAANEESCVVIDRYLSDEEYVELIRGARLVILPYLECTHSAVLFSCANHGGAVAVSDIDLFREILPDYELTFPKGDAQTLARLLESSLDIRPERMKQYRRALTEAVSTENKSLTRKLKEAFGEPAESEERHVALEETLITADGLSVPFRAVATVMSEQSAADSFQIIQRSAGEIELRYESGRTTENSLMKMRQILSNCLGDGMTITLRSKSPFIVSSDGRRHVIVSLMEPDKRRAVETNSSISCDGK